MTKFKGEDRLTAAYEMYHRYYKERKTVACRTCGAPRDKKLSYADIAKDYNCSSALVEKMIGEHQALKRANG